MKCLYTGPKLLKKMFPQFIWETKNNQILLSFDDGPNPGTTEIILKLLADNNIKALFFCVGENIEKYQTLVNELLSEGHSIGNHTYSHNRIWGMQRSELEKNLRKFNSFMKNNYDVDTQFFRPPHGQFDYSLLKVLKKLDIINVMWNLLTRDYKGDISTVDYGVKKYLQSNSIIVLHDSNKSKSIIKDSISLILETALDKGYKIGTPGKCLK